MGEITATEAWPRLEAILDRADRDSAAEGFSASKADRLVAELTDIRSGLTVEDWKNLVTRATGHPIHARFRECPYVDHSVRQPRGYPGDAVMIDYCYDGVRPDFALPPSVTRFGREMFDWLVRSPEGESLRLRRDFMTAEIGALAARRPGAEILSVAAGHAREWQPLKGLLEKGEARLTALDQDGRSLDEIRSSLGVESIRTVNDSIINLLGGSGLRERFDLVYSMGLYDYLPDGVARRLTEYLFSNLLKPGGRLILANYAPELEFAAFMEMFMRWDLIYRDDDQMRSFASRIDPGLPASMTVDRIAGGLIAILTITSEAGSG